MTDKPQIAPETGAPDELQLPAADKALRRRWLWRVIPILVLLLVLAGAVLSFPLWREWAGAKVAGVGHLSDGTVAALAEETRQLESRVDVLEQALAESHLTAREGASPVQDGTADWAGRVTALEQKLNALPSNGPGPAPIPGASAADLQHLNGEVAALQQALQQLQSSAAPASSLLKLGDRLDGLDKAVSDLKARQNEAEALLLAVGQLRETINLGQPFDAELRTVKLLGGAMPEVAAAVEAVTPFAASGIPGRPALAEVFPAVATASLGAALAPEDSGWWQDTLRRLQRLVAIRRVDGGAAGGTGNDAASVLARAEQHLAAGDLAHAVLELTALQGNALTAAQPWLTQARARLAADRALAEMAAQALALAKVHASALEAAPTANTPPVPSSGAGAKGRVAP